MGKLMTLLAFLVVVGVTLGSAPVKAVPLPIPCDTWCPGKPGSTICTCPAGTALVGRQVTCSHTDWDCQYIDP